MSLPASAAQSHADRLVESVRAAGAVSEARVAEALRTVPRHWFTPTLEPDEGHRVPVDPDHPSPDRLADIYADAPLVVSQNPYALCPQPRVAARLLESLAVRPGHRVAVLGEQTGWLPALLGHLVGASGLVRVAQLSPALSTTVQQTLSRVEHPGTRVVTRALPDGIAEDAPFHRIVVTLGCGEVSPAWLEQTAPGGVLAVPLFVGWVGVVMLLRRESAGWTAQCALIARFPAAEGVLAPDEVEPLEADTTPELAEFFARPVREAELALPDTTGDPWDGAAAFALYTAVHDARSVLVAGPHGGESALRFGLWDRDDGSLALFSPHAQQAVGYGASPLALLALRGHHRRWVERGFPGCEAYRVTVQPGELVGPGEGGRRVDERGATLPLGALTLRLSLE